MMMPIERLARMRVSFEKNKSVLATDYKFFTTPDKPAKPRASTLPSRVARKSAGRSAPKSPKRS
jgi:hypothetical protein